MLTLLRTLACGVLLTLAAAAAADHLHAQSDILLRLRSGSPMGDRFRVDSAGGFVAISILGIGIIPATGEGYRTMWHPFKAAFRSGSSGNSGAWEDAQIGFYSWAGGDNARARGLASFAHGISTRADANCSFAMGSGSIVHGTSPDIATCGVAMGNASQVYKAGGIALGTAVSGQTGTPTGGGGTGSVAIGHFVSAISDHSLALGNRVSTGSYLGAMVFGDRSVTSGSPVIASANNQFAARAAGGYRLYTNSTLTAGASMTAGGSSWSSISDRDRKENFAAVDGEDILRRLRGVPVSSWNFMAEGRDVRHIGPMAQDWHAAFGLNDDPLTINQGDFDGVNLAGVQALDRRTEAQRTRIEALEAEIAALREMVRALLAERAR
jgi:trimeric autotransporter adhesin